MSVGARLNGVGQKTRDDITSAMPCKSKVQMLYNEIGLFCIHQGLVRSSEEGMF